MTRYMGRHAAYVGSALGQISGTMLAVGHSYGALVGQWWGERRASAREHLRWQREDKHRTFEDRRRAYVDHYDQMRATARALEDAGLAVEPLAED